MQETTCRDCVQAVAQLFHPAPAHPAFRIALRTAHFGWDATLEGVRYLQAALAYPQERDTRLPTVATGDAFPHGEPPTPLLVHTKDATGDTCWPPEYVAGWSHFYKLYPRVPSLTHVVPQYVASRLTQQPGGEIGWGDHVKHAAWQLGPLSTRTHSAHDLPMDISR